MKEPFHNAGDIEISNEIYKYKLFNTLELINIIKYNPILTNSMEECVKELRKRGKFNILDLVSESIQMNPLECYYLILHDESYNVLFTSRLFFDIDKSKGYICMVCTSNTFRNKGVCKIMLNKLIELINEICKCQIFSLEVDPYNIPAIKCYENVGFIFVKEIIFYSNNEKHIYNIMELTK